MHGDIIGELERAFLLFFQMQAVDFEVVYYFERVKGVISRQGKVQYPKGQLIPSGISSERFFRALIRFRGNILCAVVIF